MSNVLLASILISFTLLLGRIAGFFRETLLAASLGPTEIADAAIVILTLPDFLVGLLLAGGLNAALIPALKKSSKPERIILTQKLAFLLGAVFLSISGLMALWPVFFIQIFAPEFSSENLFNIVGSFRISLITLPIVALIGIAGAYLNTIGRFNIPNISVLIFNLVLCFYLILLYKPSDGLFYFSCAIVLGTLARLGLHVFFMRPVLQPVKCLPLGTVPPRLTIALLGRFTFGVLGFSIIVGAPVIFRTIYAAGGDGNLALFNFSQKLFELPSALLIAPVALILLPKLANLNQNPDEHLKFDKIVINSLIAGVTLALIAAAISVVFVSPIAKGVFLYGEMTVNDVNRISSLTLVFMLSLPMLAVSQLCAAALNARGQPHLVFWGAAGALIVAFSVTFFGFETLNLPETWPSAALGYALFHLFLGVFYLVGLFGWRLTFTPAWAEICWILVRTILGILPFVAIMQAWSEELGRWGGIALTLPAFALLIWLNRPAIKPLMQMRVDSN